MKVSLQTIRCAALQYACALKLACVALAPGCAAPSPQTSSESHWVKCSVDLDCAPHAASALCRGGYCEGADGVRLQLTPDPEPPGSAEEDDTPGAFPDGSAAAVPSNPSTPGTDVSRADAAAAVPPTDDMASGSEIEPQPVDAAATCVPLPQPPEESQVYTGDYLITDAASLAALQGVTEITGALTLGARGVDGLTELNLPDLRAVGNDLSASSSALIRVVLPNLVTLGGQLSLTVNVALVELDLRNLQSVGAGVAVTSSPSLERLRLDSLNAAPGGLQLDGTALASCEIESIYARLEQTPPSLGLTECTCAELCGWLEVACP